MKLQLLYKHLDWPQISEFFLNQIAINTLKLLLFSELVIFIKINCKKYIKTPNSLGPDGFY